MHSNRQVKAAMRVYLARHSIPEHPMLDNDAWGNGAQTNAWRVSTHAGLHPSTQKTTQLVNHLFPPDVHAAFRAAMAKGYDELIGVTEGSAKQREICAFCGLDWHEPWCAMGHWYVAKHICHFNGPTPSNVAYVPAMELYAQREHIIVPHRALWLPGMSCTFVWDYAHYVGSGDHIGTIDEVKPEGAHVRYIHTDEANAGGAGPDAVRREFRSWDQVNVVFDLARLQH